MNYLDSSAVVKLARSEPESDALKAWLASHRAPLVASGLARAEAARALIRSEPTALPALGDVLSGFYQVAISDSVLDLAAGLPGRHLRSLDAIHLATADELGELVTAFVAYDKRLVDAARDRGLPVVSPV